MERLYILRNRESCFQSQLGDIGDRKLKTLENRFFFKNSFQKTHEAIFSKNFLRKCSRGSCATFSEIMGSISIIGFDKFASQVNYSTVSTIFVGKKLIKKRVRS